MVKTAYKIPRIETQHPLVQPIEIIKIPSNVSRCQRLKSRSDRSREGREQHLARTSSVPGATRRARIPASQEHGTPRRIIRHEFTTESHLHLNPGTLRSALRLVQLHRYGPGGDSRRGGDDNSSPPAVGSTRRTGGWAGPASYETGDLPPPARSDPSRKDSWLWSDHALDQRHPFGGARLRRRGRGSGNRGSWPVRP